MKRILTLTIAALALASPALAYDGTNARRPAIAGNPSPATPKRSRARNTTRSTIRPNCPNRASP